MSALGATVRGRVSHGTSGKVIFVVLISILAIVLILLGFTVLARRILGRPSALRFLTERGIDPHLWGYHLLGAGALLALFPWVVQGRSWAELRLPTHVVLILAAIWVVVAVVLSALALVRQAGETSARTGIPAPGVPARRWPMLYRGFLGSGFAVMLLLAALAF